MCVFTAVHVELFPLSADQPREREGERAHQVLLDPPGPHRVGRPVQFAAGYFCGDGAVAGGKAVGAIFFAHL